MSVYFLQDRLTGNIKIGTSTDVRTRILSLMSMHPSDYKLLAVVGGDQNTERVIHHTLRAFQVEHEWYSGTKEVLNYIEAVKAVDDQSKYIPPALSKVKIHKWIIDNIADIDDSHLKIIVLLSHASSLAVNKGMSAPKIAKRTKMQRRELELTLAELIICGYVVKSTDKLPLYYIAHPIGDDNG